MKFDTPAGSNPIDRLRVVGRATDRIDGALKVAGTAAYAYERHDVAPDQAYGYVVGASIAKGTIRSLHRKAPISDGSHLPQRVPVRADEQSSERHPLLCPQPHRPRYSRVGFVGPAG
ncbi:CO/xanthine dehydrogenase Mo-binding subunit [Sphingomonas faeni]|nr:CO/xanthine dehydrogenase Mo-binding subunit [Sphingomonas faeni]